MQSKKNTGSEITMIEQPAPHASGFTASNNYRNYVLFILFVVYGLSYVDRQILSNLIEPIRKEYGFTDMQMGLLSGTAFAVFYATLGIPIARFADRRSRVNIISASLVVWSVATALTGKAHGFWQLFMVRIGVGVGEAGCNPSAYSIISDYFPAKKRSTAQSIYSTGVYLGQFIGFVVAGYVAHDYGWRAAFYVVGLPGVAVAVLLKMSLREPPRGFSEPAGYVAAEPPKTMAVLDKLLSLPSFVNLSFASGLHALVAYGLNNYYAAFLMRSHGMTIKETSSALAVITLTGGIVGTFLGGKLSDVFAQRNGGDPRFQMWVPGIALLINIPVWLAALLVPDKSIVMLLMIPAIALGATYLGPSISATHQLVGVRERAVSGALLLFVLNIIGIGIGPILSGFISDVFALCLQNSLCAAEPITHIGNAFMSKFSGVKIVDEMAKADGLKYALCVMSVANLWSAYHYFRAAKTLRADIARGYGPVTA
jgi:MFS family permease